MSDEKHTVQVLIAIDGKVMPAWLDHMPSNKFQEMCESTDDGLVGEYFYEVFKQAKNAIIEEMKKMKAESEGKEETTKTALKWGFKFEVDQEEEGHCLYKIVSDPLEDDGGKLLGESLPT